MSFCSCDRASIALSKCSSTMLCAPPRLSNVDRRKDARARSPLLFPQTLHHELEIRRLDARGVLDAFDRAASRRARARSDRRRPRRARARRAPARSRRRIAGQLARSDRPARRSPRPAARRSSRSSRSVFAKSPASRPVKRSSFASESSRSETSTLTRDGEARIARKSLRERTRTTVVGVVEEVLLRLVEDEVDVALRLRVSSAATAEPSEVSPVASATASATPTLGSSLQLEKTTTSGSLGQSAERARHGSARAATTCRRHSARRGRSAAMR